MKSVAEWDELCEREWKNGRSYLSELHLTVDSVRCLSKEATDANIGGNIADDRVVGTVVTKLLNRHTGDWVPIVVLEDHAVVRRQVQPEYVEVEIAI